MQSKDNKPKKDGFFEYYFGNAWDFLKEILTGSWHFIIGAWYCEYCKKYHGRRVKKYSASIFSISTYMCSLGVEARRRRVASDKKVVDEAIEINEKLKDLSS